MACRNINYGEVDSSLGYALTRGHFSKEQTGISRAIGARNIAKPLVRACDVLARCELGFFKEQYLVSPLNTGIIQFIRLEGRGQDG